MAAAWPTHSPSAAASTTSVRPSLPLAIFCSYSEPRKAHARATVICAGQQIVDGKIKVEFGSEVTRITATGVVFADGRALPADIVIVATEFDDTSAPICKLIGEDDGAKVPRIWGLNKEREPRGVWHEIEGLPNM
ncbi:uncharacterized protein PHACADRAFT_200739 [Phanerochaete carnosa HHB-10118-sp]|uniref:Uncharacterized protein n=1 Tax=Phanerochaete carnosa (strain HHB-10118-sp) TaxID=650164 RepID=K5VW62_PHACS|nr:uncharacterized protein PHACADRAFT_200739 [Phanerochaete carnosa HHB-10118-sp]EKM50809.1 hypothetical protein PHACADRAFT_200739 [Phanerochaete carnosa HHB-10118-sp]